MIKSRIDELLGYPKIKILQADEAFSFSIDSMLLADFVKADNSNKIIDLGTGNAPIPLYLTLKTDAKIYGVELQKEIYLLADESVKMNNLQNQIEIINANIKDIYKCVGANQFDIVTTNPPYFKHSPQANVNKNEMLTIARHEIKITFEEIVIESKKLLKDSGSLYIVHRVERLSELLATLENHKFGIKELRFVYPKEQDDALLVLIRAKKNRPSDIKVKEPLWIYDKDGEYSLEVKKIFNFH